MNFREYPERSIQEMLINGLVHRDYLETGSEVHVDIFDDRIEITSPGGMPGDRKVQEYTNIRRAIIVSGKAEHDRYWEYPTEALREALANAVCHRDYGQANDIEVKILEDRVVIANPGQLPFDLTLEDGGIWYDGYYCADASDYEEAEMEYWNTH